MRESDRLSFLRRVGEAVRAGNRYREPGQCELPSNTGFLGAGEDPTSRLVDELAKCGTQPIRARTQDEVALAIRSIIQQSAIRRAILNDAKILESLNVPALLRDAGVEVTTSVGLAALDDRERTERCFAADLGVAAPDWAIAETGSLVYAAGPRQTRSATLLPPVHIAVVDASCILGDLMELPARLAEISMEGVISRNVTLVTGPSKTGDIELKLTTGVHGPGVVHVLIWDEGTVPSTAKGNR